MNEAADIANPLAPRKLSPENARLEAQKTQEWNSAVIGRKRA